MFRYAHTHKRAQTHTHIFSVLRPSTQSRHVHTPIKSRTVILLASLPAKQTRLKCVHQDQSP